METEPRKGYGVRADRGRGPWLWHEMHSTKKQANDCILATFSNHSNYLSRIDCENCVWRATELRRIKKEFGLKVVKVELVEVFP